MSFTLCTQKQAVDKAGINANSAAIISGELLQRWSDETEGMINLVTRRDWVTGSPADNNISGVLAEIASSHIANKIINYDMSGYTSRLEATTMLDVNKDIFREGISALKQDENQELNK